jgi:hypothetical protein
MNETVLLSCKSEKTTSLPKRYVSAPDSRLLDRKPNLRRTRRVATRPL